MPFDRIAFGKKIHELRTMRGITQTELAHLLYLERTSISNYEKGKILPDYDTLIGIAKIFNVSIEYLLDVSKRIDIIGCSIELSFDEKLELIIEIRKLMDK